LLIEVNRYHYSLSGIDFDTAIPSLLPPQYVFAQSGRMGALSKSIVLGIALKMMPLRFPPNAFRSLTSSTSLGVSAP
jgi:hypothetical protein